MKKKLKVEKAFRGKIIRRPGIGGTPGAFTPQPPQKPLTNLFKPQQVLPRPPAGPPQTVPGPDGTPIRNPIFGAINPVRPPRDPNMYSTTPPRPDMQPDLQQKFPFGVGIRPDGTLQNMHPAAGGIRPGMQQPGTQQTLPTAPVGDPRLGAATIPGNKLQMQMRGPQQAAPVQPVPAMKKGGIVRGGRAEIKGTRPAKLS